MNKRLTLSILSIIATLSLVGLASAQYFPQQNNEYQPYFAAYNKPYQDRVDFYRAPSYSQNFKSYFDKNRNSNTNSFFSENDFFSNRDFREVASFNTRDSFTGSQNFNNRNFQDLTRDAFINSNDDFSYNRGPCTTRVIHVNPSGKDRDYSITERLCDDTRISQNRNNVYSDSIKENIGFNNINSGRIQIDQLDQNRYDYEDLRNNRERSRERESRNFFENRYSSNQWVRDLFSYFY